MIRFCLAAALLAASIGSADARHRHHHHRAWTTAHAQADAVPLPHPRVEPRITPAQDLGLIQAAGLDTWTLTLQQCWQDWEARNAHHGAD